MKLEDQVCSLELAKKLKELGVKQDSLFWWAGELLVFKTQTGFYNQVGAGMNLHPLIDKTISAYTVAELGEMLPPKIEDSFIQTSRCSDKSGFNCVAGYINNEAVSFNRKTEADARAKMLIYLLENKLLTPKTHEK